RPSLAAPTSSAASASSRRSEAGSASNLRARLITHLDPLSRRQIPQQCQQVALAALRLDIVLIQDGVANGGDRLRRLDQAPDPRADLVQAIVGSVLEVEHH